MIRHNTITSWTLTWLSVLLATFIGFVAVITPVEAIDIPFDVKGPMFRIVDVRSAQGRLVLEVQHFLEHPEYSKNKSVETWFQEIYAFEGKEEWKRSKVIDQVTGLPYMSDGSIFEPTEWVEEFDGRLVPRIKLPGGWSSFKFNEEDELVDIDNDAGAVDLGLLEPGIQYLSDIQDIFGRPDELKSDPQGNNVAFYREGLDWMLNDSPKLDVNGILNIIGKTHYQRLEVGFEGSKGRKVLPQVTHPPNSREQQGADRLASRFEYLKNRLYAKHPDNQSIVEYFGTDKVPAITPHHERVDLRTIDSKTYIVDDYHLATEFSSGVHYQNDKGELVESSYRFSKDSNEDVWRMETAPYYRVVGTEEYIDILSPTDNYGARWYAPSKLNYETTYVWYEYDGLIWKYLLSVEGLKFEAEVSERRGYREYDFTFLPLGKAERLTVDNLGNLVSGGGNLGFNPTSGIRFWDYIEEGESGSILIPDAGPDMVIPRPIIYTSSPESHLASAWEIVDDYTVRFSFDDTVIPDEYFPYIIDPAVEISCRTGAGACHNYGWQYAGLYENQPTTSTYTLPVWETGTWNGYQYIELVRIGTGEWDIPPGSIITSVSMMLTYDSTAEQGTLAERGDHMNIAEMKTPWSYMSANWTQNGIQNTASGGSDWDSAGASTAGVDYYSNNIIEVDMSKDDSNQANMRLEIKHPYLVETVQAWLDGTRPNHGWRMERETLCAHVPGNGCNYTHRMKTHFHTWLNDHPTLRIMYRSPMATTCGAVKSTFYSQPSSSATTSFDGYVRIIEDPTWGNDFRGMTQQKAADQANDSNSTMHIGMEDAGSSGPTLGYMGYQDGYRSIVGFDTSGLPDDAEMVSGEMKFVVDQTIDSLGDSGVSTSHNAGANNGGDGVLYTGAATSNAGGGGGMAAVGGDATASNVGVGGAGLGSTFLDGTTTRYYGPGGNGGSLTGDTTAPPTNGGMQAVAGASNGFDGGDAPDGYGGGGGGAATNNSVTHKQGGGNGGDGTLIVRYTSGTPLATGGIISSYGGYQVHHFIYDGTPDYFDLGSNTANLELFMVGGGGGGGASGPTLASQGYTAGGGGGGGFVRTLTLNNQTGQHKVTVGKGGEGGGTGGCGIVSCFGSYFSGQGHEGLATLFGEHASPGGGGGGAYNLGAVTNLPSAPNTSGNGGGGGNAHYAGSEIGGVSMPDGFYIGWVGMMKPYNGQQATTADLNDYGIHYWKHSGDINTTAPEPAYTEWRGHNTLDETGADDQFSTFRLTDAGLASIKTDTTSWFMGIWDQDYLWPHGLTSGPEGYNLNSGQSNTMFRVDIYTSETGVNLGPKLELYWNYPDIRSGGEINPCITSGGTLTTGRTISVFYPDADPETSSWDSHSKLTTCGTQGFWDWCWRPTSMDPANVLLWDDYGYSGINNHIRVPVGYGQHQSYSFNGNYNRAFINWDTSAIPDTDNIVGAQMYLAAYGVSTDAYFTDFGFAFVKAQFASSTGMSGSDWDQQPYLGTGDWTEHMITGQITEEYWYDHACTTISSFTSCGDMGTATQGGVTTSYNPGVHGYWVRVPLNDTGLAHINKTGNTGMMAAYMNDIQKTFQQASTDNVVDRMTWCSADEELAGGDCRPHLVVEHEGSDPEIEFTDIQAGGKTIEYDIRDIQTPILPPPGGSIQSPKWHSGGTFDAQRQNFIDLMVGDGQGGGNWNDVKASIPVTAVVRTSDYKVTVTLPALPSYNAIVGTSETVTLQVPGGALYDPLTSSTGWADYNPPAPPGFKIAKPAFSFTTATPTGGWKNAAAQFTISGTGIPAHPFTGSEAFKFTKSGESDITCSSVSGTSGTSVVVQCDTSSAVTTGAYDAVLTNSLATTLTLSANNSFFDGWSSAVSGGGFSESGSDFGVFTHSASPYFTVQAFDQVEKEWGTASGVPSTIPSSAGLSAKFTSDKSRLVVGSATASVPARAYEFTVGTGIIGGTAPITGGVTLMDVNDIAMPTNDNVVGVAVGGGDYFYVYDVDKSAAIASFWTSQLASPATKPTGECNSIDFNPAATYVAVGCDSSPYLFVYPFDNATPAVGVKLADPSSLPAGPVSSVRWSADGTKIAVASNSTPYLEVYDFTGSAIGAKSANPGTLPTGAGKSVAWLNESTAGNTNLAIGHATAPYVSVYNFNTSTGVFGTKVADPSPALAGTSNVVGFHPNDDAIFVGHDTSPYITSYNYTGASDDDYRTYRYVVNFDTGYLPDDAVITGATLSLYLDDIVAGTGWDLLVQDGASASEPIVIGDYDFNGYFAGSIGSLNSGAMASGAYNDITLSGFTNISATGITQYVLRHEEDVSGNAPTVPETVDLEVGGSATFPGSACTTSSTFTALYSDSDLSLCNSPNVPKLTLTYTSVTAGAPANVTVDWINTQEAALAPTSELYTVEAFANGPILALRNGTVESYTYNRPIIANSNDWTVWTSPSDTPFPYVKHLKYDVGGSQKLWYELNSTPDYFMPDRSGTGNNSSSMHINPGYDLQTNVLGWTSVGAPSSVDLSVFSQFTETLGDMDRDADFVTPGGLDASLDGGWLDIFDRASLAFGYADNNIIIGVMILFVSIIMGLGAYVFTGNTIFTIIAVGAGVFAGVMLGVLGAWVLIVFGLVSLAIVGISRSV